MPKDLLERDPVDLLEPARMNLNLQAQGAAIEAFRSGSAFVNQRDPDIDYKSGVQDASFRADFSRMDNDAERAQFLDRKVGKGNWGKDSFGAYFVTPEGLKRRGIESRRPVSIDEQLVTLNDVADWAGDLPAFAGSVGMGLAATGMGAPAGIGLSALGAAGGYAIGEVVKSLRDEQVKTPGEVGIGIAKEAAAGAAGESVVRVGAPVAKWLLGPGAARMTPEKKALADSAIEQGFKIRPGSVTDAPILGRWEGMVRNIFGDLHAERNATAARAGLQRLTRMAGDPASSETAGEALAMAIRRERSAFGALMTQQYRHVDELVGGNPIVPTKPLKDTAQRILEAMPKTADGKPIGGKDAFVRDILKMGDHMTVENAQRLRTMLREASESPDLVPDVSMHDARTLFKSVNEAFESAKGETSSLVAPQNQAKAVQLLREADAAYARGIREFDNPTVTAITKDARYRGAVDPEMVVDYLIKPERVVRIRRVKSLVPETEWAKVRSAHANDLLQNVMRGTDDPLQTVFDGKAFRDSLDEYGKNVLEEVHGKEWVDAAYKYANALMLAEKKMKLSGGIVAANVALHPIRNLPRLVWIRAVAKLMEQPGTFKYLTEGVRLGSSTKAGFNALSRVAAQAAAIAGDETGSASITITEPE